MDEGSERVLAHYSKARVTGKAKLEGRTFRASELIAQGEQLIFLPSENFIVATPTPTEPPLETPSHSFLALQLLGLLAQQHPYALHLPRATSHFPMFYSDSQLQLLEGTVLQKLVVYKLGRIMHDHKVLSGECELEAFCWAMMMVQSRAFCLQDRKAMLPIVDLLNHAPGSNAVWKEVQAGVLVQAARAIPPGEELTLSYGNKPNCKLLLHYGFILAKNPDQEVLLEFDPARYPLPRPDLIPQKRLNFQFKGVEDSQFKQMVGFLRVLFDSGPVQLQQKAGEKEGPILPVIVGRIERQRQVLELILQMVVGRLAEFRTSVEQDVELAGSPSNNMRNIGLYRLGERVGLMATMQELNVLLKALQ